MFLLCLKHCKGYLLSAQLKLKVLDFSLLLMEFDVSSTQLELGGRKGGKEGKRERGSV